MKRDFARYIFAALTVIAVTLLKRAIPDLGTNTPTLLYHLVVIVTAASLGTGPAVLGLLLSAGLIDYVYLSSYYHFSFGSSDIIELIFYLLDGAIMIWIVSRLRATELELRENNRQLKDSQNRLTNLLSEVLDTPFARKRVHHDKDLP